MLETCMYIVYEQCTYYICLIENKHTEARGLCTYNVYVYVNLNVFINYSLCKNSLKAYINRIIDRVPEDFIETVAQNLKFLLLI